MKEPKEVLKLFERYRGDLRSDLEEILGRENSSKRMYDMSKYFLGWLDEDFKTINTYGGKQFRGGLCLFVCEALSGDFRVALPIASSLELFHNFTLIHDDIMDGDHLRRGRPTVWRLWGINQAINTGDAQFLLALQSLLRLKTDSKKIIQLLEFLETKYLEVIEGQYLDLMLEDCGLGDKKVTKDLYLEMIQKKTSVLIGGAAMSGAMIACDDKNVWKSFYEYGLNLGLSYQICDDLMSIWGEEKFTGKKRFNDILKKKKTLPIIEVFRKANQDNRKILLKIFEKETISEKEAFLVVEIMNHYNIYETCWRFISNFKEEAKESLNNLPLEEVYRDKFSEILEALIPDIKYKGGVKC